MILTDWTPRGARLGPFTFPGGPKRSPREVQAVRNVPRGVQAVQNGLSGESKHCGKEEDWLESRPAQAPGVMEKNEMG